MPNVLGINGAQLEKPTKFAPLYTATWSSGLWTNRSPLANPPQERLTNRFYGPAGDVLIDGLNTEVTNRLTLGRRPGNSVFDTVNTYNAVDRFYDFRLYNASIEKILVMVDQANAMYALDATTNTRQLVWTKSAGAGQTYMQSIGDILYFANGVDNKKWMQTMFNGVIGGQWQPNEQLNTASTPFLNTWLIDPNGNIEQLTGAALPVVWVFANADTVQIFTGLGNANSVLQAGDQITFPSPNAQGMGGMVASWLDGQTVTVTVVDFTSIFFNFAVPGGNYPQTNEHAGTYVSAYPGDGTPITGPTQPHWSTQVPSAANNFAGGITHDGTAVWTNRGTPVENWGIKPPTTVLTPTVDGGASVWEADTYYSLVSAIIDSNGNLQQVTKAGTGGTGSHPSWNKILNGFTYDGVGTTAVTWKMVATAAMMTWQPNTFYPAGSFLIETASGTQCLFQSSPPTTPYITGSVSASIWAAPHSGNVGAWDGVNAYNTGNPSNPPSGLPYPTNINTSLASVNNLTGFDFAITPGGGGVFEWNTINSAGETTGTTDPFPGENENLYIIITANIEVPVPGNYSFVVSHGDGLQLGIGGGATFVSGTAPVNISGTLTALNGYAFAPAGTNENVTMNGGNQFIDTYVYNFSNAGVYPIEINMARWDKNNAGLSVTCNGNILPSGQPTGGAYSGSVEPSPWPAWTLADAPAYPSISDGNGRIQWNNIGPATDFVWMASQKFTLPNTTIVDTNINIEAPYESGYSGSSAPSWATGVDDLTAQGGGSTLQWINLGPSTAPPVGTISTFNGGWVYAISLVNTLDDTVSNATPISAATGNFVGALGVFLPPGDGLQNLTIDPQADYVAIWRSTDGQSTPFLIPGPNDYDAPITIPLSQYLKFGYTDTTPDTGLNNLISAPILGENTPPPPGAINLTFYLNRLFYSVGPVVNWTSGPDTPAGNGYNGSAPQNFDEQVSLVKRIVPITAGALVFTVSDINLIQGNGTSNNPIQAATPFVEGVGLLSYNALDVQGSLIGLFSTDHEFLVLDPANGVSSYGMPLGDQFALQNGQPGSNWNPANVYVAWHVSGQDQAWYVSDGQYGWYRVMTTPAPESGLTWSPFAQIVPGVKAVQSIEVTPGVHRLLLGPTGTGQILYRDVTNWQDGGQNYPANAILGSIVLAQPGQMALIPYLTTESVKVGTPLTLGVLVDECLPYYTGSFDTLKRWTNDPPNLRPSTSLWAQRFYFSELDDNAAAMRHMQVNFSWAAENQPSEILTATIYGGFIQES